MPAQSLMSDSDDTCLMKKSGTQLSAGPPRSVPRLYEKEGQNLLVLAFYIGVCFKLGKRGKKNEKKKEEKK